MIKRLDSKNENKKQCDINIVSCSASGSFLKSIYDKHLKIYKTPEVIIKFINKEKSKTDFLINNPPFGL
ncbi:hypothetical protein K8354_14760 [Polaribacter litorisediminis]|uniref:hypothetical protein n=1 Tax=Polaribacter litorisediminis TaxID=1908341 RepID=UPI001CBEDB8F|nr:hypothetical protein [Polaribacter litorisediminis]UAM97552.1 hypothetical protein K8354_14760 [Polaribacter litorisediminis]